jgi:tRNA(Ile)-lysidine synthase
VSKFARRLAAEWKHLALPLKGERILVAVSGGADSTALLLALDELLKAEALALKMTVAHLDHGLRGAASQKDAEWVAELADKLGYEIALARVSVKERARLSNDNLEQAARRARYEFLAEVARAYKSRVVLTAHTMNDQAETMLLRLLRGTGPEGLSGMEPVRALAPEDDVLLVRPLLSWAKRTETEEYCRERGIRFRIDEMNADEEFMRVRVRQKLLPLLETFNPRALEALSRTARLLREDSAALASAAKRLLEEASESGGRAHARSDSPPLRVDVLARADEAVRRRALRQWIARGRGGLRRLELVHLLAVEGLLSGERGGRVALLPGGSFVERRRGRLYLHPKKVEKGDAALYNQSS